MDDATRRRDRAAVRRASVVSMHPQHQTKRPARLRATCGLWMCAVRAAARRMLAPFSRPMTLPSRRWEGSCGKCWLDAGRARTRVRVRARRAAAPARRSASSAEKVRTDDVRCLGTRDALQPASLIFVTDSLANLKSILLSAGMPKGYWQNLRSFKVIGNRS